MTDLLVVRPEPGASATAARAAAKGLKCVVAPIFAVRAVAWEAPDPAGFDALLFTSAHAPRLAGDGAERLRSLPCYAVGEATAESARRAGFADIRIGGSDGAALIARAAADGRRRLLHLCGREHKVLERTGTIVTRRIVYAAEALDPLSSDAAATLRRGATVLLHSPRAAEHFASLVDAAGIARDRIRLAAISPAAAAAAGPGWGEVEAAPVPDDEALLELAAKLCKTGAGGGTGTMR